MRTFTRKKKYKARDPYETVNMIRNILQECDMFLSENNRFVSGPDVASCRIWLSDPDLNAGDFGTNGKGMTTRYSLASAYGEFMERLQNNILFGDYQENAYRHGLTKFMAAPDEVMLDGAETWENAKEVLAPLMRIRGIPDVLSSDKMPSVPYYDVINDRTVLLPHKTLRMVSGSNGMAAGNTYKEAVIQGLSELYERQAVLECYRDDPVIKQIHPEQFRGNDIYDRLVRMQKMGYGIKILDLSMGKGYPVVGLVLDANGNIVFKAGADPCPVTALERCLTEIFQGTQDEVKRNFHRDCCPAFPSAEARLRRRISDEEISYHVDGSGKIAHCLFNPSDEFSEDFQGTDGVSEDDDYEYMISLTKRLGYGLYIRDWSFLGFPSYQIIVPEMSNYDLIYDEGGEVYGWSFDKIEFRIDALTKGCAERLNTLFEKYEKNVPAQDSSMSIK